ncbi:MAG: DUF2269 family protein [Gaiellaceae bacterium]
MTLFETLKFLHITAAVVGLGGGLLLTALMVSALFGRNGERMRAYSTVAKWAGPRIFAPAWALVLAFGIWATLEGGFDWGDAWIAIGIIVVAIAFVFGPTLHERHERALGVAIEEAGPTSERTLAIGKRALAVMVIEASLLIFAVWAMTAKPGL